MMKKTPQEMSKVKQFASNFKPTFQSSMLFSLCNFPSEKTEINFVLNYWPFSKYKSVKKTQLLKNPKSSGFGLRNEDKELIKTELQSQFASGSIQFDDESLMSKVNENLAKSSGGFQPEWDEDSNETKFEKKRQEKEKVVDLNNNNESETFNIQEQIYQDKRNYELEKYKSAVRINISIERGNQLEANIIEKINKEENMKFVQEKSLRSMDFGYFRLCGIIDGIDAEKKTLVEVKTRSFIDVNKRTINLKDKLQCLAYLKLTGCERCLLVESGPKGQQNKFYIDWDEKEFEDRIVERLRNFVIKYRNMKESEFRIRLRRYKF